MKETKKIEVGATFPSFKAFSEATLGKTPNGGADIKRFKAKISTLYEFEQNGRSFTVTKIKESSSFTVGHLSFLDQIVNRKRSKYFLHTELMVGLGLVDKKFYEVARGPKIYSHKLGMSPKEYSKLSDSFNNFAKRKLILLLREYSSFEYGTFQEAKLITKMNVKRSYTNDFIVIEEAEVATSEVLEAEKNFTKGFLQEKDLENAFKLMSSKFKSEYLSSRKNFLFDKFGVGSLFSGLIIDSFGKLDNKDTESLSEFICKEFRLILQDKNYSPETIENILNLFVYGIDIEVSEIENAKKEFDGFDPLLEDFKF